MGKEQIMNGHKNANGKGTEWIPDHKIRKEHSLEHKL